MLRAADAIARTDTGRQRRENEDNAYVRVPLFVVADGMGGAQAGEVASALAVQEFQRGLIDADIDHPTAEQRLVERVQAANRRIYEMAQAERERSGMGTTLTAVYVDDSNLTVAHVGDSRAYIFRDGDLTRVTHDHSLVEELMRRGKLTPEQAAEHPQRSIITRALGIEPEVEVDTWTYPGKAGDVVLLCSDGLTSMVDEHLIEEVLRSETDLQRVAERLIHEANHAGGRDNITVVLFRLEEVGELPDDGADEQLTVIGMEPPLVSSRDLDTELHTLDAPEAGAMMTVTAPVISRANGGAGEVGRRRPPLARTQGRPEPKRRRRGESLAFKLTAAVISTLIVVSLFGAGGYLATRQLYFIGTNKQGIVTLYDGLPYDIVAPFYEQSYVSGLPASLVPAAERKMLLNHHLRSQKNAIALIRAAERGQLTSASG
jgi:serine/threonine protein phosphatase PrpC